MFSPASRYAQYLVLPFLLLGGTLCGAPQPALAAEAVPATPPAQQVPDPSAWQAVVTGQIEAFRKGDAAAALGFAASGFRKMFSNPAVFMVSIAQSGYAPIMTSVSHSFGSFTQLDPDSVMQVVTIVGPRQEIYQAIYSLGREADGWRVQGVTLMKEDAVSV